MPALVCIHINMVDISTVHYFSLTQSLTHTHTCAQRREIIQFLMVCCIFVYFSFHGPNKVTIIKTLLEKKIHYIYIYTYILGLVI